MTSDFYPQHCPLLVSRLLHNTPPPGQSAGPLGGRADGSPRMGRAGRHDATLSPEQARPLAALGPINPLRAVGLPLPSPRGRPSPGGLKMGA